MPGALPRVHLVTPAIVERTVARYGVQGILTDRERRMFEGFSHERRRDEWLSGRIAAKRAVRRVLGACDGSLPSYADVDVWNDVNGAPRLTIRHRPSLGGRLSVSISHTTGAGLAAVVDRAESGSIGVDIEPTTTLPMPLIRRVMSPDERARLDTGSESPSALALWTAKEAALKAASHLCSGLASIELFWKSGKCTSARRV